MSITANIIISLIENKLKQIDPQEVLTFAQGVFAEEIAALKASDSDGNSLNDFVQVEQDVESAFSKLSDAVKVIEAAHAAAAKPAATT